MSLVLKASPIPAGGTWAGIVHRGAVHRAVLDHPGRHRHEQQPEPEPPAATQVTFLQSITENFNNGDELRANVTSGGTVTVYRNGSPIGVWSIPNWASYSAGDRIGLRSTTNTTSISVDNFFGGNL